MRNFVLVIVLVAYLLCCNYLLKNSLAIKKGVALFKMASVNKIEGGSQEMAVMV